MQTHLQYLGRIPHIDVVCLQTLSVFAKAAGNPKKSDRTYQKISNRKPYDARKLRRDVGTIVKSGSGQKKLEGEAKGKGLARWMSYGGSLPSILQALDSICDLDEALKPWEETLNNKERTIILKEQSDWERAVEIFEWFKRKDCYELNVIHYNIMLRILGRARRWDQVERLWSEMKSRNVIPTNSTYGTLIDSYSKGGLKEKALLWLEEMQNQGLQPDEVTMGIVVQTYKLAGEFEEAERFFKNWMSGQSDGKGNTKAQTCCSSYTYNTMIDTYGKSGQLKEASDTFVQMLREGIAPTTVTFNTMIHICGNHGCMDEVRSLMMKMEELKCLPDTRTYNILISLYAKNDDINAAVGYLSKMKAARLQPDIVSYRTLIYAFSIRHMVSEAEALTLEMEEQGLEMDEFTQSALTRMYLGAGLVEQSWAWFEKFHKDGRMSSECYSANIDAFGEHGELSLAESAYQCCLDRQKLSVIVFNVMIKVYGIAKKYEKACELFDTMEDHRINPDEYTYNSLIQILSGADLPDRAKFYVQKMQEVGLIEDCIPYSAVISNFAKLGELEKAVSLFKEMVGFAVQPDIVLYGVLINAFAEAGSVRGALSYVDAMKDAGFTVNAVINNSLIKLYTKVGYLNEARETYELVRSSADGPDIYASNCMIDLYCERGMIKEAEEIFEDLKQRTDANEFSFAMMLRMYKKAKKVSKAVKIAHEMKELGLLSEPLSYSNAIEVFVMDGRLKEAAETFFRMMDAGVQPNDAVFRSLGTVLIRCGASKQAIDHMELRRKEDAKSGLKTWAETMSAIMRAYDDTLQSCGETKNLSELDADDVTNRKPKPLTGVTNLTQSSYG
ncbi:Pentatricopeptide repeat-containing protein [Acorus calamus]|uniref:Pentatricopeptide repeat-containing protein n=1 Tax=Acorus calamus TaxID=4465 RepID=A0AAV9ELC4_ACOCL|nr:Pentatricopeptide repeat-containing protein [Acorus calamus]